MAATINTNIASINAQRNLAMSGQSLNTTMQRLSSGLRVNSAKDDAAGLAIAERMNTQVKGLTVAARNANDGISLAQTAEGALGKVGDMLQRMRELAVQASNATNSNSDRVALQAEVGQLAAEIDRVAKQTNFNGQKILDGSFAGAVFQVGANSGDNVTLGALADTRSSMLSQVNYAQNQVQFNASDKPTTAIADHAAGIDAGKLQITIGSTPAQTIDLEAIKPATSSLERLGQVVTAINNKSVDTGLTAYMRRDEVSGEYGIEFLSEKTNAVGTPLSIQMKGFTQATTGIGEPTEAPFQGVTKSEIPAALFKPAAIDTGSTDPADAAYIQAYYEALVAANEAWTSNGATGTPPVTQSQLVDLATAITGFTAAPDPTTAGALNDKLATITVGSATPTVGTTPPPSPLPDNVQSLYDKLVAVNEAWIANGGTETDQPFSKSALTDLANAIAGYPAPPVAPDIADADAINTALGSLATQAYVLASNATVGKNQVLATSTTDEILSALDPVATPAQYATTVEKLSKMGVDTSKFDLNKYQDSQQPDGWSTRSGFTAADALTHLKEQVASEAGGGLDFVTLDQETNVRGLDTIDITTQEGAWIALKKIDSAIDQINGARATLGAMQSRFETAVNNIDIQVENLSAARGRIMDADFAVETANLSRTQILQQAGTAMVAQANQIPQNVLQLLQG